MKKLLLISSLVSFAAIGTAQAADVVGDAAAGKAKSMMCMACHGPDGNSPVPINPKLAGQHPGYIAKQLADFKSKARVDATMNGMTLALTEQDMANLAAYYSSQAIKGGKAAEDQVELGQTLYRAGNTKTGVSACAACHGPTGGGNPQANFPSLNGQHADYTAAQLKKFRKGDRANDAGSMMRNIAAKMTDAEINAVSQYIQGLN